jgi:hypothetical protein
MPYKRVLPRDLFNESKLLKCLGQLALILHDYGRRYPLRLEHERPSRGFMIERDPADGGLYCVNLNLYHRDGRRIELSTNYNSKSPYPLFFILEDESGAVFTDDGKFDQDFLDALGVPSGT